MSSISLVTTSTIFVETLSGIKAVEIIKKDGQFVNISYDDALNSQLRDIVHNADKASAILVQGYEDPDTQKTK